MGSRSVRLDIGFSSMGNSRTDRQTRIDDGESVRHLIIVGSDLYLTHPLPDSGQIRIGRVEGADLVVPDPTVSRLHTCIYFGPSLAVEDLGSRNGTMINSVRIEPHKRFAVTPRDVLRIGSVRLIFETPQRLGRK